MVFVMTILEIHMRYIGKIVLIVSAILVAHSARPAFAQRSEKPGDEQLETPVTTTRTDGGFKNLNSLPESIRRSKIYARMLFEYGLKADENGYYNMESRLAEFK